ncbi:MAG TPA: zinc ABC transporter substrate-binding protein [Candidatus Dormibacteraeota bacterium]|jgi:zinc/manganese transport system substrate-binding protein|nr:zinc ABC transporter substrate-binding protein [Candidatus Dormibacteraeota bacterium]
MNFKRLRVLAPVLGAVVILGGSFSQATGLAASSDPVWQGNYNNFNTPAWYADWGVKTSDNTRVCQGATSSWTCNWGYPGTQGNANNLVPVADSSAPGGAGALQITYPAPSGPPSCGCGLGGGQFYQYVGSSSNPALASLASSHSMDLKYYYKMPTNFDFGKGGAWGKFPGLWGGGVPGCESGSQHCANGWSTRYMWRGLATGGAKGEIYWYSSSNGGYGSDLGLGSWTFKSDNQWHAIEQQVVLDPSNTATITVWQDNAQVFQTSQATPYTSLPSGTFFSTFNGGHTTAYSPSHTTMNEVADFTLSATGPQTSGTVTSPSPTVSASPTPTPTPTPTNPASGKPGQVTGVVAAGTGPSSATVSWNPAPVGGSPTYAYAVYAYTPGGTPAMFETLNPSSMNLTGLVPNQYYTFTVIAYNPSDGWGAAWSQWSSWILLGGSTQINVVASLTQIGYLVGQVGGTRVHVTTILTPNDEPDVHTITPADQVAFSSASVIFESGVAVDTWMNPGLLATGTSSKAVDLSQGAMILPGPDPILEPLDPHWWYDVNNAKNGLKNIVAALSAADPGGAATYQANADAESASLDAMNASIHSLIDPIPAAKRIWATAIDSQPYMTNYYGISYLPIDDVAAASDPIGTAHQLIADQACAFFVDAPFDPLVAAQITANSNVPVIVGDIVGDGIGNPGIDATIESALVHDAQSMANSFNCSIVYPSPSPGSSPSPSPGHSPTPTPSDGPG